MGGEVLLQATVGETDKIRKFFKTICEDSDGVLWLEAPEIEDYGPAGCWIEVNSNGEMEVGYQAHHFSTKWADAVACGIRDHFKILRGGWDSIGYSKDFMKTRPYKVDMQLTRAALKRKPENAKLPGIFGETMKDDIKKYKKYQKIYEDKVKELFKGVPDNV